MRNWIVFGVLVVLIIISFVVFGDRLTRFFEDGKAIDYLKEYGQYAWAIAILLLVMDLFLPLPGTIIMSALGFIYGPVIGGLLASLGSLTSGVVAYGLCRSVGEKNAIKILGNQDYEKGHKLFNQKGGWIVAISRWLPILPEAIACIAGLNRMNFKKFIIALFCGSIPLGFVFAYVGYYGITHPAMAIILSAVLPALLWTIAQYYIRKPIG